jgi:hypothetical protein
MGLVTKIYWLTDRQSQSDFDFDFRIVSRVPEVDSCSKELTESPELAE